MNGSRQTRRGGSTPLDDVVHWFQSWLGRRRDSLGRGGVLPRANLRPSVREASRDVLQSTGAPVTSESFDRAFRTVVASGDTAPAATEPESRPRPKARDSASRDVTDWRRPPGHVMRRDELYRWLDRWFGETDLETVGGVGEFVRRPWLRIHIGAVKCHLNANTTREGVAEYLELARAQGPHLAWSVVSGRGGVVNEVAVGSARVRIRGFHLFTDSVFRQPGVIGGKRAEEKARKSRSRRRGISAA